MYQGLITEAILWYSQLVLGLFSDGIGAIVIQANIAHIRLLIHIIITIIFLKSSLIIFNWLKMVADIGNAPISFGYEPNEILFL